MSDRGFDWRKLSRGLFWVGIGTLLLANTTGAVSWSFWIEALPWWPLLLVALGLRLTFERSRFPAGVLLSPLLILGTLAWLALMGPRPSSGDWTDVRAERSAETGAWRLEGELVLADLDVRAAPLEGLLLVHGRTRPARREVVRVRGPQHEPSVRLGRLEQGFSVLAPARREQWELEVSDRAPVSLDLGLALTRGTLDLAGTAVQRVELEGAFNSVTLRLGEIPEGQEEDVRIRLEGAFNELALVVPPSTPVEVRTDGFLTRQRGGHPARPAGGPGYVVELDGAFSRVDVRSE